MKKIILVLTLCVISSMSFAKSNHPSIDDDRDFSFEHESTESQRGVANTEEIIESNVEMKENAPKVQDEKERDIASDEEVFDKSNEQGIRYWKY